MKTELDLALEAARHYAHDGGGQPFRHQMALILRQIEVLELKLEAVSEEIEMLLSEKGERD